MGEGARVPPDAQAQLLALLEELPELQYLTINPPRAAARRSGWSYPPPGSW